MRGKKVNKPMPDELPPEALEVVVWEELTLSDFFKEMLCRLWMEGEGFSSKRPLGNSGWQCDVYAALIEDEYVPGELDEYGYAVQCDSKEIDKLVVQLIVDHL